MGYARHRGHTGNLERACRDFFVHPSPCASSWAPLSVSAFWSTSISSQSPALTCEHARTSALAAPVAPPPLQHFAVREQALEFRHVPLHPLTLEQPESGIRRRDPRPLLFRYRLTDGRERYVEIQQRIQPRRFFRAHRHIHRRPRRPPCLPPVRDAHQQPTVLTERHGAQKTMCIPRRPRLRLKHPLRLHQLSRQRALLRRPLHRRK